MEPSAPLRCALRNLSLNMGEVSFYVLELRFFAHAGNLAATRATTAKFLDFHMRMNIEDFVNKFSTN